MNKILVTGCAGFIGSHLCENLIQRGYKIIGVDNFDPFYSKQTKARNMQSFLHHSNFTFIESDIVEGLDDLLPADVDLVVHLAAKAGVRPSIQYPGQYLSTNVYGTQKVLEFMKLKGIKKLVFASSSSVYGNNKKIPFNESDRVDNPISPYAFTKKAGELLNHTYYSLYNIDVINLRFFTVYGPRQRPDLAIHSFTKKIFNDEPVTIFGDGSSARDYTYIDDTVSGIVKAIEYSLSTPNHYLTINLGNHHPVQLADMVNSLYQVAGKMPNIKYEAMPAGDVDITYADISLGKDLLGYSPCTPFRQGLEKFVNWYKQNHVQFA